MAKPGPEKAANARDILLFFVTDPDPVFTAREIADAFEKTRQWADNRLGDLEDAGYLKSKNPGGGAKFYWITDAGKTHLRDTGD